jgi:hypothetical protein
MLEPMNNMLLMDLDVGNREGAIQEHKVEGGGTWSRRHRRIACAPLGGSGLLC